MRCTKAALLTIAFALVLRESTAAGQTPPPAPERWPVAAPEVASEPTASVPPPATRWYGWQTLLADFGALALTIGLGASVDEHNDAASSAQWWRALAPSCSAVRSCTPPTVTGRKRAVAWP